MNCPKCNAYPNENWDQMFTVNALKERDALQASFKELKATVEQSKENHVRFSLEIARLRKVVDAARKVSTIDKRLRPGAIFRMEEALRELDGELKCPMHDKPGCACG